MKMGGGIKWHKCAEVPEDLDGSLMLQLVFHRPVNLCGSYMTQLMPQISWHGTSSGHLSQCLSCAVAFPYSTNHRVYTSPTTR